MQKKTEILIKTAEKYIQQTRRDIGHAWVEVEHVKLVLAQAKGLNTVKSLK